MAGDGSFVCLQVLYVCLILCLLLTDMGYVS